MKASGVSGSLKHGYRVVARLSSWTLDDGRVEAIPSEVNAFALAHGGPFDLVLEVGKRLWVWRDVSPIVDGARFATTVVGAPEKQG